LKAIRIHEDGGPEVLRYEDVPDPAPGEGEILIRLRAASLNQPDLGFADVDKVPRELVAGAAYNVRSLTLAFDLARRVDMPAWRAGVEYWMRDETFGLRAGAHSAAATAGFTVLFPAWRKLGLFLDYAFALPLYIEDSSGSHRAALGVLF